jgi:hypothetical protein
MGTLYFILKSTITSIFIVCLLQIKLGSSTLEFKLMNLIRNKLAPQILNIDSDYDSVQKIKIGPSDFKKLRKKIYESEALKSVQKKTKELLLKEMAEIEFQKTTKDN